MKYQSYPKSIKIDGFGQEIYFYHIPKSMMFRTVVQGKHCMDKCYYILLNFSEEEEEDVEKRQSDVHSDHTNVQKGDSPSDTGTAKKIIFLKKGTELVTLFCMRL